MNEWWGYLHVDGSVHVKRYFGPKDIAEAWQSDFVQDVTRPFLAEDRDDALQKIHVKYKAFLRPAN
jgi:hypothetical protein